MISIIFFGSFRVRVRVRGGVKVRFWLGPGTRLDLALLLHVHVQFPNHVNKRILHILSVVNTGLIHGGRELTQCILWATVQLLKWGLGGYSTVSSHLLQV